MGFFQRLKEGLKKTSQNISNVFKQTKKIDDDFYDNLEETLIESDMGFETTEKVIDELREKVEELGITDAEECKELVKNILRDQIVLNDAAYCYEDAHSVVFIIGVNGVGKTTSVGKLAALYKGDGRRTMVAAADTFRAGAIEQLRTWAERAGVDIIAHNEGADPSAVVFDAVKAAKARKTDLLLIDTAGRLHNKKNLMDELAKMRRVIEREYPEAYVETMIVLDGSTGQNALEQARQFSTVTEINGIILTKLDGTAKGGIAIAIMNELKCPIKYIGVGEKITDLQKFDPEEYINALFADFDVKKDTDIIMDSGVAGNFEE